MKFRAVPPLAFLFLLVFSAFSGAAQSRPNVLIVVADQWRGQAFGFAGDPNVKTPHLDAFERESVDFKNAVSSIPVCSPMRASLLTGQHALTHGVFMNDVPLSPNAMTLPKVLRAAGYDTAFIGKWHVNGDGRSKFIPRERRQGFDYWKALECTHNYLNSYYYADGPEKLKWDGYDATAQTRDAETYLRSRETNDKPFLLELCWGPPHDPYFIAPKKYQALYSAGKIVLRGNVPRDSAWGARRDLAGYYASCTALDDCFGELMQTLRETGVDKTTIVIFTSDHGDMLGSQGLQKKQKPFDESIRVPMLIRCPASMGFSPKQLESPIATEDIMPTVLGLCGVASPTTVQGVDFSGYMRAGTHPPYDAALISCVAPFSDWSHRRGGKEYRGIRTARYTYVRDLSGPWLLFDNEKDPLQLTNLAGVKADLKLQDRLDARLHEKLKQAGDEFLPGDAYIKKWKYTVDANGTIPYEN